MNRMFMNCQSLKQLDLSPYKGLSDKEKKLYELIEAVYNLTGHP